MNGNIQQARIFFSGIVQGVGFRYTAQRYAADAGLKGWVKNLADGRVEACVQGSRGEIEDLCGKLKLHYDCSLRAVDIDFCPVDNAFEDFRIIS